MVKPATRKPRRLFKTVRPSRAHLYLAPTFMLLGVFCYYPPLLAFARSFYTWNGANAATWCGLDNFRFMLNDEVLLTSVWNQIKIVLFATVVGISAPFIAAELIFNLHSARARYWYRVLLVVPMVVPGVVLILLWQFIYDPNVGLLNALLGHFGIGAQAWLHDPKLALWAIMCMGFPFVGGVNVLIILAGLNNIGTDVFDAARIDGVGFVQRMVKIDIPLVMGQVKLLLIMVTIGALNGYGAQLILTDGGPGYSTMVPGLHMYHQAFLFDRLGYACAIGLMLFLVILVLTAFYMGIKEPDTQ